MKKVLIASTALVAATVFSAGAASASEKIKLNLGGFSKWWVVGQWQNDTQNATGVDYNTVDVKGDNEVFFGGSTTLDNGLQVGIDIQLEAGGNTDQGTDTIDESYVFIGGGFGKFIIGSKNNGTYLIHNTAPDAAGNWNEGGILTGGLSIVRPTAVRGTTPSLATNNNNTTAIVTDGDSDGVTYVSPTFYGLTFGATYKPNSTEDVRGTSQLNAAGTTASEIYGAGILYANTFGGVGVKADIGWATYDVELGLANKTGVNEYSTGLNVSYAGFTLGGSFRKVNADTDATAAADLDLSANAWDVGLQYASGPYAVSLAYFRSSAEDTVSNAANDRIQFYQLSGKYTLGAGVDALASIGYAKYDDETNLDVNENKGWVAMTGLSLAF
ncbi:MAG TPA: porin [Magnetospirillum sp.]|nr:porin [Magnetospirillum sp.]